jgi:hypothetical protein
MHTLERAACEIAMGFVDMLSFGWYADDFVSVS